MYHFFEEKRMNTKYASITFPIEAALFEHVYKLFVF